MRGFVVFALFALAAALTPDELRVIEEYKNEYGARDCQTLNIENGDKEGYLYVTATGLPNHPVHKVNPNDITNQAYAYYIPETPRIAKERTCTPLGEIGFALNGVPLFNPLTGPGDNAVQGSASEQFDGCHGHASPNGAYHYHETPALDCIFKGGVTPENGGGTLMGVALDGFPIYYYDYVKNNVSWFAEILDECHGINIFETYRYYMTDTFPYIIGCFKGEIGHSATRNRQLDKCPDGMANEKQALCSCGNGPGGAGVEILHFESITDSECHYPYSCDISVVPEASCPYHTQSTADCKKVFKNQCNGTAAGNGRGGPGGFGPPPQGGPGGFGSPPQGGPGGYGPPPQGGPGGYGSPAQGGPRGSPPQGGPGGIHQPVQGGQGGMDQLSPHGQEENRQTAVEDIVKDSDTLGRLIKGKKDRKDDKSEERDKTIRKYRQLKAILLKLEGGI